MHVHKMMSTLWMYTMGCACVVESMIESVMLYLVRVRARARVRVRARADVIGLA